MILTQVIDALIDCKTSINNQQWTDLQANSDRLKPLSISVGRDLEVVNTSQFLLSSVITFKLEEMKDDMLIMMNKITNLEQQTTNLNTKQKKGKKNA